MLYVKRKYCPQSVLVLPNFKEINIPDLNCHDVCHSGKQHTLVYKTRRTNNENFFV